MAGHMRINAREGTFSYGIRIDVGLCSRPNRPTHMRKIDILNFITSFRKAPNDIKTYQELLAHLGAENEATMNQMLQELQQSRVIREVEGSGQKSYQVIAR